MEKSCFVIMGYGIKNGINLDATYEEIIKPCINMNHLVPFRLYDEDRFNAFRCDEISGSTSIDFKFVTCLNGADIVIADISTMNVNAIYELGARHALKPRSTILLCSKDKEKEFKFFDLTYVPIIFYDHQGLHIDACEINRVQNVLNKFIDFAVNSDTDMPDNPISRALNERNIYKEIIPDKSLYAIYIQGKAFLDNNEYESALDMFNSLVELEESEENILLYALAKYKIAEHDNSEKSLIDILNYLKEKIDIDNSTSEELYGRVAAICLRLFNISGDKNFYYEALKYYMKGAGFCKKNLYCPRNYCALLLRICEVTDDINIIKEYYYTAKHHAKIYVHMPLEISTLSFEERVYYQYNKTDLEAIINDVYTDCDNIISQISTNTEVSLLQKDTLLRGIKSLNESLTRICDVVK